MAKIKNTVGINVQTTGTQKAASNIDQVTKAQTRQTNAGVSASKQFSAQAQGLGGFVAAYAGAAANVFALQQAFDALRRAAQAETIVKGTQALALEIGASGKRILDNVREITDGQLSLAEAAQNTNIALSAGFGEEQISRLTKVSEQASRALGRSLTDAMTRVTRGAAKMEPELLDELGIFTRIDPAVQKYANSLNVAASSLTNYERRQAFVNAVIEEGERKFSSIDTSVPSTQKSIEQLIVAVTDLATTFGQLVADVLKPFIDFISNNAGITLLAFLGVLRLVFGKGAQVIGNFGKESLNSVSTFTKGLVKEAKLSKTALEDITSTANKSIAEGGLKGVRGKFKGQDPAQLGRFEAAKTAIQTGAITDPVVMKETSAALREQAARFDKNSQSARNLTAQADKLDDTFEGLDRRTKIYTKTARGLDKTVSGLTKTFRVIGKVINGLFLAIAVAELVGTLFDVSLLEKIKGLFVDLSQAAENFRVGLTGLTAAAAGGSKEFTRQLKLLGATDEQLEKINETNEKIAKSAAARADFTARRQATRETTNPRGRGSRRRLERTKELRLELGRETKALEQLRDAELKKSNVDQVQVFLINKQIEALEKFGRNAQTAGAISRSLGIETSKVAELFDELGTITADGTLQFTLFGIKTNDLTNGYKDLTTTQKELVDTQTLLVNTIDKANTSFDEGTASSETLSKQLGGARKAFNELAETAGEFGFATDDEIKKMNELRAEIEKINDQVRRLKELETIGKAINDNFGSSIKALDNAVAKGLVGLDGVAKSTEEQSANAVAFLRAQTEFAPDPQKANAITVALDKQKKLRAGAAFFAEKLNSEEEKLLANREKSFKAAAGMQIQLMQAVEKEKKAQEKTLATLRQKLEVTKAESELRDAQRAIEVEEATQERINRLAEKRLDISNKQIDLAKAMADAANQEFAAQEKLLQLEEKELSLRSRIEDARDRTAGQSQVNNFDRQIAKLQNTLADMEFFPGLSSEEDRRKVREEIINKEFEKQMKILDMKETQINKQFIRENEAINRKEQQLQREIKQQDKLISDRQAFALLEERNLAARQEIEIQKMQQEKSNLQAQLALIDNEEKLAVENSKAAKIRDDFTRKEALQRIEALEFQALVINKFAEAVGGDTPFVKAIEALVGSDAAKTIQAATDPKQLKLDTEGLRAGVEEADRLRAQNRAITATTGQKDRDARRGMRGADIAAQEKMIELTKQEQNLAMRLTEAKNTAAIKELQTARDILTKKLEMIDLERRAVDEEDTEKRQQLQREREEAIETFQTKIDALNRERDMVKQFTSDISLAIGGELKNSINGFFQGIAEGKGVLESAKDAFSQFMQNIIGSIQEKLTEKFISPVIDSILGGIFAGGGPVQLAGGGAMRRDRVPALLEPGEFVIRKPMARAIGGPALSAMNGHGKGLGMPTIDVQINNSGQPKDAEAQVKPNMDVNKMVVEIVTRDLRNNGPIRKTLRGDS